MIICLSIQDMDRHRILFKYDGQVDDDNIVMAFSRKHVESRKTWLTNHMDEVKRRRELGLPERYLYTKGTKHVSYSDFINLELVLFSNADNERSIPCLVDGLKPGQRKVMFTCFKRNDKREVKVAQLSGSVAEMSAYHHGEVSLQMTIVNLAQNYVGSNNINLLEPRGQFGTRLTGGKDCASARYIFTMMSPLTRLIYHPLDDPLLQYQVDDGQKIEPLWYLPIIPMVLVNGAEGIGTGWSTKIPNYNPRELISNLRRLINKEEPLPIHPWYKNFTGTMEYISDGRYVHSGNIQILPDNRIEITELPVGTWTQNYKENVLEALSNGTDKVKAIISDYREYHTDTTVRFVISFATGEFERLLSEEGGFHRVLKLSSSLSTNQMHAFDKNNCLRRFPDAIDFLKEYFVLRLEYYVRRKDYLVGQLTAQADKLSDQARFILEKCEKTLVIENKQRKAMIDELVKRGYRPDPIKEWQRRIKMEDADANDDEEEEEEETPKTVAGSKVKKEVDPEKAFQKLTDVKKFDYLLGMSMWMLTEERKNELLKQRDAKLTELDNLKKKTPEYLWMDDLDNLEEKLNEVEEKERLEERGINLKQSKAIKGQKAATTGRAKKTKAAGNEDIFPDPEGERVKFTITDEIMKKFQIAVAAAKSKERGPKVKAEKKDKKEKKEPTDEIDDFDALVEAGGATKTSPKAKKTPAVKKEPAERKPRQKKEKENGDGLKQSKLDFKSKPTSVSTKIKRNYSKKTIKFCYLFNFPTGQEAQGFI